MSEVDELLAELSQSAETLAPAMPRTASEMRRLIAAVKHEREARNDLLEENHREIVCLETAIHLADNELAAILRGEE